MFYELIDQSKSPVSLEMMKSSLIVNNTRDDDFIQQLIDSCTDWCEKFTGRDFRQKTWVLTRDSLDDCIKIRKTHIQDICSISYIQNGAFVQLSKGVFLLSRHNYDADLYLSENSEIPSVDSSRESVKIEFITNIRKQDKSSIIVAIIRHVTLLYTNRGDCECGRETALESGAMDIYRLIKIQRV